MQTTLTSPAPTSLQPVPNVDFASLACVNTLYGAEFDAYFKEAHYFYNGPSPALSALAGIVAATGNVSAVLPPSQPNASWTFEFAGPALTCAPIATAEVRAVEKIISNSEETFIDGAESINPIAYLSWSTGLGRADNTACTGPSVLSFAPGGNSSNFLPTCRANGNNTVTSLFMGLIPNFSNHTGTGVDYNSSIWLQCNLKNATYSTNFTFVNGVQNVTYDAVLNDDVPEIATGNLTFIASEGIAFSPVALLRRLSYQAVFDAFQQLFIGVTAGGNLYDAATSTSPGILNTVIAQRPELQFLSGPKAVEYGGGVPFTSYLRFENGTLIPGLVSAQPEQTSGTLIEALEELFTKLVVSLLSVNELQYENNLILAGYTSSYLEALMLIELYRSNPLSPFAIAPVEVTYNEYRTTYVYSPAKLWISYGLAVGTAAFAAVIGLYGLLANGASYSFNFSTILRMVRNASMSEEVKPEDEDGRDPLPSYLAKSHIWLPKTTKETTSAVGSSLAGSGTGVAAHTPLLSSQGFSGPPGPRPLPQLPMRHNLSVKLSGRSRT